jgi:hypothetical protein
VVAFARVCVLVFACVRVRVPPPTLLFGDLKIEPSPKGVITYESDKKKLGLFDAWVFLRALHVTGYP